MKKILLPILLLISFFAKAQVPALNDTVRSNTLPQYTPQFNYGFYQGLRLPYSFNSALGKTDLLVTGKYLRNYYTSKTAMPVNVLDYGAVRDSTVNSTAAFQAATNTGRPVYIPDGYYRLNTPVVYTGRVIWFGNGNGTVLKSDGDAVEIINGTNSQLSNFRLENITTPYIIRRDTVTFAVVYQGYSNGLGYQPTVNDVDIWSSLTTSQQNQFISAGITFYGYSTNVNIWNITGRFASIASGATSNSSIRDCTIQGGKGTFGAIVMGNIFNTGQRSKNNIVSGCDVYYASYNGINFNANDESIASHNNISFCGESGIKLYQGDFNGTSARNYRMHIEGNTVHGQFYDGLDMQVNNPRNDTTLTENVISNNISYHNHGTGIITDGRKNIIAHNRLSYNISAGLNAMVGPGTIIDGNYLFDNNKGNTSSGVHEITLSSGGGVEVTNNHIFRSSAYNGYGIFSVNGDYVANNVFNKYVTNNIAAPTVAFNNSYIDSALYGHFGYNSNPTSTYNHTFGGTGGFTGSLTAASFIKTGGTGSNLLADDGTTVAKSTYATSVTAVTGGVINWPGTLYTTPTTGSYSSGTLTFAPTLASQAINKVFAGPASGSSAAPTWRSLVANDIPTALNATSIGGQLLISAQTFFSGTNPNTLNFGFSLAADAGNNVGTGWINFSGYQDGTLYFRDFNVGDGKNNQIAKFKGSDKSLTLAGTLTALNFYSTSTTPTIVAGTGAGTSPTISISGNNQDGIITLTIGTTPTTGTLFTVTMSGGFAYLSKCSPVFTLDGSSTATTSSMIFTSSVTSTTFTLNVIGAAPTASSVYIWHYHNGGY